MSIFASHFRVDHNKNSLGQFGLSEDILQSCAQYAWDKARRRTALASPSASGTDLYQEMTEQLAIVLSAQGWRKDVVHGQQRIVHPDGLIGIAVSSATNVASDDPKKQPRTRSKKGLSTLEDLDSSVMPGQDTFDLEEFRLQDAANEKLKNAPLWFLLHEEREDFFYLSLARPAAADKQGYIIGFSYEIHIKPLSADQDLDLFREEDGDGDIDFEVPRI